MALQLRGTRRRNRDCGPIIIGGVAIAKVEVDGFLTSYQTQLD